MDNVWDFLYQTTKKLKNFKCTAMFSLYLVNKNKLLPVFNDNLVICAQVTMTVDGTYREKWTTSGTFSMLSSNKVFIGGSSQPYKLPGANTKTNFVGCMKKVCFYL